MNRPRLRLTPRGELVALLLVLLALLPLAYAAGHAHGQADAVRTLTDRATVEASA